MKLTRAAVIMIFLGLALFVGLLAAHGFKDVWQAFSVAGWGILLASAAHLVPMLFSAAAWQQLNLGRKLPKFSLILYVLWLRAAVNNLLPVARIGGEIISARVMVKNGMRTSPAIASVVVDTTVSVLTVFLFSLLGVFLLGVHVSGMGESTTVIGKLLVGLLVAVPVIVGLMLLPRFGFFGQMGKLLKRLTPPSWGNLAVSSARVDRAILQLYRRRKRVAVGAVLLFVSWIVGALHIYISAKVLGVELTFGQAIILEALVQAVNSAAFAIPGALGALEFAYLFFGGLLGIPQPQALAMALMRRARDLIIYIPGLLAWQWDEGKWLMSRNVTR